eukprot:g1708.t1
MFVRILSKRRRCLYGRGRDAAGLREGLRRTLASGNSVDRLPEITWKAEDEFSKPKKMWIPRQTARVLRLASDTDFLKRSAKIMGYSALTVYLLGTYEAHLLLNPEVNFVQSVYFTHSYATEQLISSCVWTTKPADLVALSIGYEPSEILYTFEDNAEDAARRLRCLGVYSLRSVIAGFVCLSQVLRTVGWGMQTNERYRERVKMGREALFGGISGQILRLCGRSSDTMAHTMRFSNGRIVPVFERPQKVADLIQKYSKNFTIPVYWQVAEGRYSTEDAWRGMTYEWSNFVTTTSTGKRLLYMEADATNEDQSLAIARRSTDLNVEDISQAFRAFDAAVHRGMSIADVGKVGVHKREHYFRPFRVLLGDLKQVVRSGSGRQTLRNRVSLRREADVLIDSQAPVIDAILHWCRRACGRTQKEIQREVREQEEAKDEEGNSDVDDSTVVPIPNAGQILFDTTSTEYLENVRSIFKVFGVDVLEAEVHDKRRHREKMTGGARTGVGVVEDDEGAVMSIDVELPRFIYCSTTAETVNAVKSLVEAGEVDPMRCCVLVDEPEGLDALQDLIRSSEFRFEVICSALIYDDLFRQVRGWARMGHSAKAIQAELDGRFEHIDAAMFYTDTGKKHS